MTDKYLVVMYGKDGTYVHEWSNVDDAWIDYNNIAQQGFGVVISQVIQDSSMPDTYADCNAGEAE